MREILFRGKRPYNSWVFGSLLVYGDGSTDITSPCGSDILDKFHVDRKTVGQYTGLKDKNGMRIFEGDIVEVPMYRSGQETLVRGLVIYEKGAFSIEWFCRNYGKSFLGYIDDIQVIGNEFDNPELLK